MGFKTLQDLDAENAIAIGGKNKKTGKANPTSAEGYYLGSRRVKTRLGDANFHVLQTPKGNLGVWGKTNMDSKLATVTPGTMIRISFNGMQATKNGDMYKYQVEVDEDNTIEVTANLNAGSTSGTGTSDDEGTEDYDDDTTDEEQDDTEAYEAPAPAVAAKSNQERKNKVQALLNGKAKK